MNAEEMKQLEELKWLLEEQTKETEKYERWYHQASNEKSELFKYKLAYELLSEKMCQAIAEQFANKDEKEAAE